MENIDINEKLSNIMQNKPELAFQWYTISAI